MSSADLSEAIAIIRAHPNDGFFCGPRSEDTIIAAELALGGSLPPSYRIFVSLFGAGNFRSLEIYGVITDDFAHSGIPDAIWLTLQYRSEGSVSENDIVIADTGDGGFYCLEHSKSLDGQVFLHELGRSGYKRISPIAEDFGAFLLEGVRFQSKQLLDNPR